MSHIVENRERLLNRVRKMRGQLNSLEKAIGGSESCALVLQRLVACRGAMSSLVVELLEEHVRAHVLDPEKSNGSPQAQGAQELIEVLRTYLR